MAFKDESYLDMDCTYFPSLMIGNEWASLEITASGILRRQGKQQGPMV
jgi:hypothetical protein